MQTEITSRLLKEKHMLKTRLNNYFHIRDINISIIFILLINFSFFNTSAFSQYGEIPELPQDGIVYNSTDVIKNIPDMRTITSTLTVAGSAYIYDIDVLIGIDHSCNEDLDIYLIAPDGTRIELATDIGPSEYGFYYTIFDDEASLSIAEGSIGYTGYYRPEGQLSELYMKKVSGEWTLEITDDNENEAGLLVFWSLIIEQKLLSPVIQSTTSVSGEICDTIFWDDTGGIQEYKVNTSKPIPGYGTTTSEQVINDYYVIEDVNVLVNINHNHDSGTYPIHSWRLKKSNGYSGLISCKIGQEN